jgi:hypothetical protein
MTTLRASIHMSTQRRRTTPLNSAKRFELLKIEAGSIAIQEVIALSA